MARCKGSSPIDHRMELYRTDKDRDGYDVYEYWRCVDCGYEKRQRN